MIAETSEVKTPPLNSLSLWKIQLKGYEGLGRR